MTWPPSLPPSLPPLHKRSVMLQAPVSVWFTGLMQGTHSSPSPQLSCPSSADCGLVATSGMHFDRQTPAALPTDEVQVAGLKPPAPRKIGWGMQPLVPTGDCV